MSGFSKLAGTLGLGGMPAVHAHGDLSNASPGAGFEALGRFLANEDPPRRAPESPASSGSGFAALGALLPEPSEFAALDATEGKKPAREPPAPAHPTAVRSPGGTSAMPHARRPKGAADFAALGRIVAKEVAPSGFAALQAALEMPAPAAPVKGSTDHGAPHASTPGDAETAEMQRRLLAEGVRDEALDRLRDPATYREELRAYLERVYREGAAAGKTATEIALAQPPIVIDLFPGHAVPSLNDGRHRYEAAKLHRARSIRATVRRFDARANEVSSSTFTLKLVLPARNALVKLPGATRPGTPGSPAAVSTPSPASGDEGAPRREASPPSAAQAPTPANVTRPGPEADGDQAARRQGQGGGSEPGSLRERIIGYLTTHPAQQATAVMDALGGTDPNEKNRVLVELQTMRKEGLVVREVQDQRRRWSLRRSATAAAQSIAMPTPDIDVALRPPPASDRPSDTAPTLAEVAAPRADAAASSASEQGEPASPSASTPQVGAPPALPREFPRGPDAIVFSPKRGRGSVPTIARHGRFFVHASLDDPSRFAISDDGTGLRIAHYGSMDDARALMWELNSPKHAAIFDRIVRGTTIVPPEGASKQWDTRMSADAREAIRALERVLERSRDRRLPIWRDAVGTGAAPSELFVGSQAPQEAAVPASPAQRTARATAPRRTFDEVRTMLLAGLREHGWTVNANLQHPHAAKDGRHLWFWPEAIKAGSTTGQGEARSLSSDMREYPDVDALLRDVERWFAGPSPAPMAEHAEDLGEPRRTTPAGPPIADATAEATPAAEVASAPVGAAAEATAAALAKSAVALSVTDDPFYAADLHRQAKEAHKAASVVQAGGIFVQHNRAAVAHARAQEAAEEAAKYAKERDVLAREILATPPVGKRQQKAKANELHALTDKARQAARAAEVAAEPVAAIVRNLEMAFRGHVPPPVAAGPDAPRRPPSSPVGTAGEPVVPLGDHDLWTAAQRRDANLAAMRLAAELAAHPRRLTDEDRRILARYSGWGGLSLEEVEAKGGFPSGFPKPNEEGLIHEYYTPSKVCLEVARVVQPLLSGVNGIAAADGYVHALEPSCGIGRFVRAFSGPGFENIRWHAVEYSPLSASMLRTLMPDLDLFEGPFQRWVAQHEQAYAGRLNLVVSNPPYGAIGTEIAEDPVRRYRRVEKHRGKGKKGGKSPAYKYFLRRSLDLLAPGGLGVFLIPAGFLSGTGEGYPELRKVVLLRHHLACAFRLPGDLFPATGNPAFDLVFFRARPGMLKEPDQADARILEGRYFEDFPQNVLGKIVENYGRWKTTAVVGDFTTLPEVIERPLCATCAHVPVEPPLPPKAEKVKRSPTAPLLEDARLASASSLGRRINWYLAAVAAQESETPVLAWGELHRGLTDWVNNHGVPSQDVELAKLAIDGEAGAQAFLAAFVKGTTRLIDGLATRPSFTPRYTGAAHDIVAKAEYLYRQHRKVTRGDLGDIDPAPLFAAGWCEDEPGELHPADVYYYGALWPKYDRSKARAAEGDEQAALQARKLLEIIKPALFDDIRLAPPPPPPPAPGETAPALITPPPPSWFPIDLLTDWLRTLYPEATGIELERVGGVIKLKDIDYDEMGRGKEGRTELLQTIGWFNHDKYLFTPRNAEESGEPDVEAKGKQTLDDRRQHAARIWSQSFVAWAGADPERRRRIEETYQRAFQGYRTPDYGSAPLDLARWYKGVKLSPHQNAGARRVLANRRGLVAFDVGVGKTYTGLAILAGARQEGWVKRPVILVPASIIWKWERDIRRCLPDYRVGIIGSKRKTISRGEREGYETSATDTAEERAGTWRRFQAGEYDVVLMTYESLARTKMREATVTAYARETAAIERQMTIRKRNLKRQKKLSEREKAVLNQGVAGWVAQLLELPEKWEYDPGIIWEDLGIDMLLVDEAQNFKNLYKPEERAGGVPRYMGSDGEGSARAWQLDFRCAAVRANTGGAGVVLLSATPAKNSPLEFYTVIQLIDHDAWKDIGVSNPEEFIDLFLQIESEDVVNTSTMRYQRESVCSGFVNLDMLRSVVFRYGEFKTAEEVGLKLPTPKVTLVEVDMTDEQEAKYSEYLDEIAQAKARFQFGRAAGYRMRLPLVAIHVDLDEGYTWPSEAGLQEPAQGVQDPTTTTDGVVLPVRDLAIAKKPKRVAAFGSADPFKVLGVSRNATDDEIRAAWRQLSLQHHPDQNPDDPKAGEQQKQINAAYEILSDPNKRTAWIQDTLRAIVGAGDEKKVKRPANEVGNPHSPKFDALAKEIVARPGCGHIVFCDNIAAHWWIRAVLLQAGIPAARIAVMNGVTAKEVAERQKIALNFNGEDGDPGDPARGIEPLSPIPPKYDVVIGNGIMHEGVDLQRRTCAIHHLDLPYEPATLQQRNGRGHRQGNKFTEISIFYYFARRSSDGGRYQLIKGKLGWMTALLNSTARDTNNPGAQSRMSKEEEAIFESRDPEATRALIAAAKAAHEAAVNAKIAHEASATLRGVVERFWRARHSRDPEEAARMRSEGEQRLAMLARVNPVAWPWMSWAAHARDVLMLVPPKGDAPVYTGLRLAKPNVYDPIVKEFVEFGRVFEGKTIGVRRAGAPTWTELEMDKVVNEKIKPEHVAETWPADDDDLIEAKMRDVMARLLTGSTAKDTWNHELAWHWASDAFLERQWPRFGAEILRGWRKLPSFWAGDLKVPVLTAGVLSVGILRPFDEVLPPTEAGFADFMRLALPSKATWGELDEAARFWWGRTIPRNLVAGREKPEKEKVAA